MDVIEEKQLYIGGRWQDATGSRTIQVHSPSSGELVGSVISAEVTEVDQAVLAARAAFDKGSWRDLTVQERVDVIERVCKVFESSLDEAVTLVAHEMGVPISLSKPLHSMMAIQNVRNACQAALAVPLEELRHGQLDSIIRLEPVGVVASIAPWNGPIVQSLYMIVYPLLAGCSVVLKPAPETPLTANLVARAFDGAGLPEGVLSVIQGGADIGEALVRHPAVDAVFFTGSTETGRRIGSICGEQLKRMVLELGGKSAAIVLEDADLAVAIPNLAGGAFGNTGQNCAALSRVLVPESLMSQVLEQLSAAADGMVVGDALDPTTDIGPLVSERQLRKVRAVVDAAVADGAYIANTPPPLPEGPGWYVRPTVLAGLSNSADAAQNEIFGPVVCVIPYRDEQEAIDLANASPFGLHGAVFSQDEERAMRVARAVRTGTVSVNGNFMNTEAPFGGFKDSGIGRKYGIEGYRSFLEVKAINYGSGPALFDL